MIFCILACEWGAINQRRPVSRRRSSLLDEAILLPNRKRAEPTYSLHSSCKSVSSILGNPQQMPALNEVQTSFLYTAFWSQKTAQVSHGRPIKHGSFCMLIACLVHTCDCGSGFARRQWDGTRTSRELQCKTPLDTSKRANCKTANCLAITPVWNQQATAIILDNTFSACPLRNGHLGVSSVVLIVWLSPRLHHAAAPGQFNCTTQAAVFAGV